MKLLLCLFLVFLLNQCLVQHCDGKNPLKLLKKASSKALTSISGPPKCKLCKKNKSTHTGTSSSSNYNYQDDDECDLDNDEAIARAFADLELSEGSTSNYSPPSSSGGYASYAHPGSFASYPPPPGSYASYPPPPGSFASYPPPPGSFASYPPPPGIFASYPPPPGIFASYPHPPVSQDSYYPSSGSYSYPHPSGEHDSYYPSSDSYSYPHASGPYDYSLPQDVQSSSGGGQTEAHPRPAPPAEPSFGSTLVKVNTKNLDLKSEDSVCSICLSKFTKKSKVVQGPCLHKFHDKCIRTWLREQGSCPVCKTAIH